MYLLNWSQAAEGSIVDNGVSKSGKVFTIKVSFMDGDNQFHKYNIFVLKDTYVMINTETNAQILSFDSGKMKLMICAQHEGTEMKFSGSKSFGKQITIDLGPNKLQVVASNDGQKGSFEVSVISGSVRRVIATHKPITNNGKIEKSSFMVEIKKGELTSINFADNKQKLPLKTDTIELISFVIFTALRRHLANTSAFKVKIVFLLLFIIASSVFGIYFGFFYK